MRHVPARRYGQLGWCALAAAAIASMSLGCAGLSLTHSFVGQQSSTVTAAKLPGIPTPREAIQVDIMFIERPDGDPLLGTALWNEIDEIGPGTIESRAMLARNGFRVGHVGSSPPRTMDALLGLARNLANDNATQNSSPTLSHHRVVLPSGGDTQIEVMPLRPKFAVKVQTEKGTEFREYTDARGLLRMWVHRTQDGWARLEFQPEIHHGSRILRAVPDEQEKEFELRQTQSIDADYAHRFDVTLNTGEMAVISSDEAAADSLGRGFFHRIVDGRGRHKLLIVRLSNMIASEAVYSQGPSVPLNRPGR